MEELAHSYHSSILRSAYYSDITEKAFELGVTGSCQGATMKKRAQMGALWLADRIGHGVTLQLLQVRQGRHRQICWGIDRTNAGLKHDVTDYLCVTIDAAALLSARRERRAGHSE